MHEEDEERKRLQLIGIYMTIPFVLAVPPIMGWWIGTWIDKKLETSPFFMFILIGLGIAAGIREFYRILKKYGNGA